MQLHYPVAVVLAAFALPGACSKSPVLQLKNSSAVQVHSSYRDWASSMSLLTVDTNDCWLGTIDCSDGSKLCLNIFHFAGCVFDKVTPINLDEILPGL